MVSTSTLATIARSAKEQALIQEAHQRSASFGLSSRDRPDYQPLKPNLLAQVQRLNHGLYTHALPVMETLYEQITNTHSMVVLSDAKGLILHSFGDDDFLARAEKVALQAGVEWSEQVRGTNAVGTALQQASAVVVHSTEHFLASHHFLTCSCAPIMGTDGRVLGALDVTSDQHHFHPHTLALVKMSAQLIENHLLLDQYAHHLQIHFHSRPEFLGTMMAGVAVFDEVGQCISANRSAQFQLNLSISQLRLQNLESLFGYSLKTLRQSLPLTLQLPSRIKVFAQIKDFPTPRYQALARPVSVPQPSPLGALRTGDPTIERVVATLEKVLNHDLPILLLGETGSGKEVFAQAFHASSKRASKPFVALNCAALPESLIESELFGYVEGAFTGAKKNGALGKIMQANGGTLFLDEIGDMPLAQQARLLRVLETRQITPLGSSESIPVDICLISATLEDLAQKVAAHQFRSDLYYRLNGVRLLLPALRQRNDGAVLIAQILAQLARENGVAAYQLTEAARQALLGYHWPGNVRELAHALRIAALLSVDGVIDLAQLPEDLQSDLTAPSPASAAPSHQGLQANKEALYARALTEHAHNLAAAARALGVSRSTLYRYKTKLSQVH